VCLCEECADPTPESAPQCPPLPYYTPHTALSCTALHCTSTLCPNAMPCNTLHRAAQVTEYEGTIRTLSRELGRPPPAGLPYQLHSNRPP
jgi:hypothetical protein